MTQCELKDTVGKLAVPLPRTNYLKNSFSYQGAVLWNSLPPNLQQAQTLNGFRIGCRQHFSEFLISFLLFIVHGFHVKQSCF